jgi:hypothetical protein
MRILVVTQGEYGKRMVRNLRGFAPEGWSVSEWQAPLSLPMVMDYPEEYLPESLPASDLVLVVGESPAVAEFVPGIARISGAKAVIVPIDRSEWLPKGLGRQLAVFPRPLCSLTESSYNLLRQRVQYQDLYISEFARHFGRPRFVMSVDRSRGLIVEAKAGRDAVCGCARYVAQGLVGTKVDEAEFKAGMLHHHYPCLGGMSVEDDFSDTLMHVSGNIAKEEVKEQVKDYVEVQYFTPQGRSDG